MNMFKSLVRGYQDSTKLVNRFKLAIDKINWGRIYDADGEMYYVTDDFTLVIDDIDPFKCKERPTAIFADGSMVQFPLWMF